MNVFERKYCIIDSSGNYYAVNDEGTLTVVQNVSDAKMFDILEANRKISSSGMSRSLRTVAADKRMMKKKENVNVPETEYGFVMEDMDFEYIAKELAFIQNNMDKYQKGLREQQSRIDEEISDIMHFVELYERDEKQSLELMDQLQECRDKRRKVKDEYFRAETFSRLFKTVGMNGLLKDINKQFSNMEKREYIPRRLHSLFVQGVKRNPEAECTEIRENILETEDCDMDYARQETMFDGKDNDWSAMISQQADFFENVWQYIMNLRIDLDDIEDEIEELMEECEDAKCNVTQGYKMFKRLKELRIIRKAKREELGRVQMIAECFDCKAMADTYIYLEEQFAGVTDDRVIQIEVAVEQEEVKEAV